MSMKPFLRATYKLKLMFQSEELMYDEIMTMTGGVRTRPKTSHYKFIILLDINN